MAETLKPCPFCGRKKGVSVRRNEINKEFKIYTYSVKCSNCTAQGPSYYHESQSVEAWNSRK